jgi:hypothetical protein
MTEIRRAEEASDQISRHQNMRDLISVMRHPSSVFELPVSDVCEFLAAGRGLGIEPTPHVFARAAECLRNALEAMAFAGHALRPHQLLERPWWMRWSLARLASCHVRLLQRSDVRNERDARHLTSDISHQSSIEAPVPSNARSRHLHAPAEPRAASAAALPRRLAYPPRGTLR